MQHRSSATTRNGSDLLGSGGSTTTWIRSAGSPGLARLAQQPWQNHILGTVAFVAAGWCWPCTCCAHAPPPSTSACTWALCALAGYCLCVFRHPLQCARPSAALFTCFHVHTSLSFTLHQPLPPSCTPHRATLSSHTLPRRALWCAPAPNGVLWRHGGLNAAAGERCSL